MGCRRTATIPPLRGPGGTLLAPAGAVAGQIAAKFELRFSVRGTYSACSRSVVVVRVHVPPCRRAASCSGSSGSQLGSPVVPRETTPTGTPRRSAPAGPTRPWACPPGLLRPARPPVEAAALGSSQKLTVRCPQSQSRTGRAPRRRRDQTAPRPRTKSPNPKGSGARLPELAQAAKSISRSQQETASTQGPPPAAERRAPTPPRPKTPQ